MTDPLKQVMEEKLAEFEKGTTLIIKVKGPRTIMPTVLMAVKLDLEARFTSRQDLVKDSDSGNKYHYNFRYED